MLKYILTDASLQKLFVKENICRILYSKIEGGGDTENSSNFSLNTMGNYAGCVIIAGGNEAR